MRDEGTPEGIVQVIYRELKPGDFRKAAAESNDSPTGGGARDLRFAGYEAVKDVFRSFLPGRKTEKRKRGGKTVDLEILTGVAYWIEPAGQGDTRTDAERTRSFGVEFEEPTTARPTEGRLTRIYEYPFFEDADARSMERSYLMITKSESGKVYFHIVPEHFLRQPDPDGLYPFNRTMLACIDARRRSGVAVIGHYNFVTSEGYCNGS